MDASSVFPVEEAVLRIKRERLKGLTVKYVVDGQMMDEHPLGIPAPLHLHNDRESSYTKSEKEVVDVLMAEGWTLYRNGWPDLVAEKDGEVRFIEVKRFGDFLNPSQVKMHGFLKRFFGVPVEIVVTEDARRTWLRHEQAVLAKLSS